MLLLLLSLLGYFAASEGLCPPSDYLAPFCACKDMSIGSMITCNNIFNAEDLVKPIRALAGSRFVSFALEINNSSLRYIPHDLFKGTQFEKIRFVSSEVMSLSDSDLAFEGLEDTLVELRAADAHFITSWEWGQLRRLRRLSLIDVHQVELGSVSEPFPAGLESLTAVGVTKASLSHVADTAFAALGALRILNLKQNEIAEVKRSMLPDPAEELIIIDLSENKLDSLPKDFFSAMPKLEILSLQGNKFLSLPQDIFALPLKKLFTFHVYDNPIRCDCRLAWLRDSRLPYVFDGRCSEPRHLAGKDIFRLEYKDLLC